VKIVGLSSILVGVGAILYYAAARRNRNNQTEDDPVRDFVTAISTPMRNHRTMGRFLKATS
jgi:hypothetical protein